MSAWPAGSGVVALRMFQKPQDAVQVTYLYVLTQDAGGATALRALARNAGDPRTQGTGGDLNWMAALLTHRTHHRLGNSSGSGTVVGGEGSAWQGSQVRFVFYPPNARTDALSVARYGLLHLRRLRR